MKKQVFLRALLGIPFGIAVGYAITILISIGWGQGEYSPCVPALTRIMGNEMNAVTLQTVLTALIGACFAACSVIWEIESWSIARQTGTYFLITAVIMMPVAYFANWMEHSVIGFLVYFGIFVIIFILLWLIQYMVWKNKIKKMNSKIR